MNFKKYQGAGNDFLIADNRDRSIELKAAEVAQLCDRRYGVGADGLMLLQTPSAPDCGFDMVYYNSDGSTGMMCGNGGRCIAAFADSLGIRNLRFLAADGVHEAEIVARNSQESIVRLGMIDVKEIVPHPEVNGVFLDTGTRHLVVPVAGEDLTTVDVDAKGRELRWLPQFGPIGVNVNFTQWHGDTLHVRTFEKGVEAETFACGTGICAAAIANYHLKASAERLAAGQPVHIPIRAKRDDLAVEFIPTSAGASSVYLIGPATFVADIIITV